MRLSEKLLLSLSRKPENKDYQLQDGWNCDNALCILSKVFPDFLNKITGKEIIDFGCGEGYQSIALARNGAKFVLGIDINKAEIEKARDLSKRFCLNGQVEFSDKLEGRFKNRFDIVISQNSMEHFLEPANILNEMKSALSGKGVILITFGPPWLAPYGSHTQFFTKLPWANILFSERTVMEVRKNFRDDGAAKYEEVKGGFNKMTVGRFERIISECELKIIYKKYECVKGVDFLGRLPLIRELFINQVTYILSKSS